MSIDSLQEKIRMRKNPSVVHWILNPADVPQHIRTGNALEDWGNYCKTLLFALKDLLPAVRFGCSSFVVYGPPGVLLLSEMLQYAKSLGYYVLLDGPEILNVESADIAASGIMGEGSRYCCDGLILNSYLGSDILKPFLPYCTGNQKDIFVLVRTGNKSASELQDLLTGSRLVHGAAADMVNRNGREIIGKCGYSSVAALASATAPDSLRTLRQKYPSVFLLVDGYDSPSANAKNCSAAFDRFGHGALVCCSTSVTAAWKRNESDGTDYLDAAASAVERMKKNLARYVTVM